MKRKLKHIVAIAFAFVLLFTAFPTQAAEELIKISDKEYAVVITDAANALLCNKTPVSGAVGTKVFLTYTVHKLNSDYATTSGVTGTPRADGKWPCSYGSLLWNSSQRDVGGNLFDEGYTYIFRLERTEEGFTYQGLKMKGDKVANIQFTKGDAYNDEYCYYGIWTGGTGKDTVNAVLTHVRCYDENGNDLGLKSNLDPTQVKIYEDGEAEDYKVVKGGYYCKANKTLLVLHEQKVAYIEAGAEGKEVDYKVMYGTQLILKHPEGKEIWNYTHLKITDDEDNVYRRLQDAKVTFVTGEKNIVKPVNVDTRYRVEKPENPTKEGDEFLGWYLGNGKEYKFDSIITESITLYAKWRNGDGEEYLAVNQEIGKTFNYEPVIAISASVLVLAGLITGYIMLIKKRGKTNDKA
ncbi:MAG: InlB B-repeat-containing protein [Lachnospira sp.]|nr:InlB B-repeat-containing protein [Lachnospira sp.]